MGPGGAGWGRSAHWARSMVGAAGRLLPVGRVLITSATGLPPNFTRMMGEHHLPPRRSGTAQSTHRREIGAIKEAVKRLPRVPHVHDAPPIWDGTAGMIEDARWRSCLEAFSDLIVKLLGHTGELKQYRNRHSSFVVSVHPRRYTQE